MVTFEALSEMPSENHLPWLDKSYSVNAPRGVVMEGFAREITAWRQDGFVVLPKLLPEPLMDAYHEVRSRLRKPGGWRSPVPYMHYSQIRDICLYRPLADLLGCLIGAPMGLHLNLTGYVSTEREWHQDDYLNPPHVMAHYVAVWMALDDVSPDCGPFEFVRGSHRWPLLRREKVLAQMDPGAINDQNWPTRAEAIVTPACIAEIKRRGAQVEQFIGKKGDVLIWHGRLLHQGARAKIPGTTRKALIAHYSAIDHRPDMPAAQAYKNPLTDSFGFFFPIDRKLDDDERV